MRQLAEEDLQRAATSLVSTGLRVAAGERFVVVGDAESQPMMSAIETAGRAAGAEMALLRLDQLRSHSTNHTGDRPHRVLPDAVRRGMLSAQASAFVASAPHAESSMREQLLHVVGACRVRHAHMPGITPLAFSTGLSMDFAQLAAGGRAVEQRLELAREITAESAEGTRLVMRTASNRRWISRFGTFAPGVSVTLPTGSIVTCPETISGKFAATASVGEYFGAREGVLREAVIFDLMDGRIMNVTAPGCPKLVADIETMIHVAPNSDRVGLVVIGVNSGVGEPTGEAAIDALRPGLHLVLGDPLGKLTGATWSARTSFAACQAGGVVRVDGVTVAEAGVLVPA